MADVPNLLRPKDRLRLFIYIAMFGFIAILIAGAGILFGDPAVDFQNTFAWGGAVVFCAAVWAFTIGKRVSTGTRHFASFCALLLYFYALLMLFWLGGWLFFNADTLIVKGLAISSAVLSFVYIRVIWKTSELALNLERHLSAMGVDDKP